MFCAGMRTAVCLEFKMDELRIANWNVEWRRPNGRDAVEIRRRLAAFRPDIVCLTEAWTGMLGDWGGHTITSRLRSDKSGDQRSVLLWSRQPWTAPDDLGHAGLPRQCFVAGTTTTPIGELRVAGIIIPYHMADVAHGTRDRKVWEQHEVFLDHLPAAIASFDGNSLVLGDFNQRLPSPRVPGRLQAKLWNAFTGFEIVTATAMAGTGSQAIDHIALGSALAGRAGPILSNQRDDGKQLSDHFGVTAIVKHNRNG